MVYILGLGALVYTNRGEVILLVLLQVAVVVLQATWDVERTVGAAMGIVA